MLTDMKKAYDEDNLAKLFMPAIIRRYRDRAGLSQQQLADSVGIAKSYISALELGYRAPNLNVLVKIAAALGVRPGEMLDAMVESADDALRESIRQGTRRRAEPRLQERMPGNALRHGTF